jgi:outer membrane protein TolC
MKRSALGTVTAALLLAAGCRSPEAWKTNADEAVARHLAAAQIRAFGATNAFDVVRPSDVLRERWNLPSATSTPATVTYPAVLTLTLDDCLQIGARNSREYQDEKERVFLSALTLDLEEHAFENSYAGLFSGNLTADESGDGSREARGGFEAGVARTFKSGATFAGKVGLDIVRLLTGDETTSQGILVDATLSMPLLRGFGRDIVTEPLTQAERNLVYALWTFERYRKDLAVGITSDYLSILQSMDEVRNAQESVARLSNNLERAQSLAESGRMSSVEVGQSEQQLLRAQTRLLAAERSVDRKLDAFKITLGLPVTRPIELDRAEMARVGEAIRADAADPHALEAPPEPEALQQALSGRLDLLTTRGQLDDARRKVKVARDALRAGLDVSATLKTEDRTYDNSDQADLKFSDGTFGLGAVLDLPWERTRERNAYRESLIGLDQAERAVEAKEDEVALGVRNAISVLQEAVDSYRIQVKAMTLAEFRVQSTALFLEAGRAQIRDVLDSEESLVTARNSLSRSVVAIRLAQLNLLRDTERLEIDSKGLWREKQL